MERLLIGLVLGVVVGLGLGFALFSGDAGPAPGGSNESLSPGVAPAVGSDAGRAPVGPVDASPAPAGPATEREAVVVDPATTPAAADAAARRVGNGVIHGFVRDVDGRPLGDVVVRAERRSEARFADVDRVGAAAPPVRLDEAVRAATDRFRDRQSRLFEARTDALGAFAIAGLPDDAFSLSAYKPDYVIERALGARGSSRIGDEVDFVALAVVTVRVRVVDATGEPVAAAVVECERLNAGPRPTPSRYRWTPDRAELRLPAGDVQFTALAGADPHLPRDQDAADLRSEAVERSLVAGAGIAPVELVLSPRLGIRARVRFEGPMLSGTSAYARLMALGAARDVDLDALAKSEPRKPAIRGDVAFLDLEPGSYAVGLTRMWNGPVEAHAVAEVSAGVELVELTMPDVDPADFVVVHLRRPDGRPIDGARFSFEHQRGSGSSSSSSGFSGIRRAAGVYFVSVPDRSRSSYYGKVEGHAFRLGAEHDRYGSSSVALEAGQGEVELVLLPPARLEVAVAGYPGAAYSGRVRVQARRVGSVRHRGGGDGVVGADGIARLQNVEPGDYELKLVVDRRDGHGSMTVAEQQVVLGAGDNQAHLAMPTLYALEVVVPGAKAGDTLIVQRDGGPSAWVTCDGAGLATLADLAAGRYSISARGAAVKDGSMAIDVPCGRVTFAPN